MIELIDALREARNAMPMPPMRGVGHAGRNGAREYRYATLQDVLACVMPPLLERGVMLTQGFDGEELITRAYKGERSLVLDRRRVALDGTPQEQGSAETYAKRYALCSVFCLAGMDDDDGAAATANGASEAARRRLWAAVKRYAELNGLDAREVSAGLTKSPDWTDDAAHLIAKAEEFEEACNGTVA